MQLLSIGLARAIGFIEINDLDPRGRIFFPDVIPELVQRYHFQKFPQSFDQLDETKGIEFWEGKAGGHTIVEFVIYNTGFMVETRSGTDVSKQILEDILEWGRSKLNLTYESGMIQRWLYISNVTFRSDIALLTAAGNPLAQLAEKAGRAVSEILHEDVHYEPVVLTVGNDPLTRKYPIAPFTIQRRAEVPFSENRYFSEAALPTDLHIRFLEEFERDVTQNLSLYSIEQKRRKIELEA